MSGAGDRPSERDGRLACRRVDEGERGREGFAESAATCRASSSMWAVKVWMSASDEATRAAQGRGVTSVSCPPAGSHRLRQPTLVWR